MFHPNDPDFDPLARRYGESRYDHAVRVEEAREREQLADECCEAWEKWRAVAKATASALIKHGITLTEKNAEYLGETFGEIAYDAPGFSDDEICDDVMGKTTPHAAFTAEILEAFAAARKEAA